MKKVFLILLACLCMVGCSSGGNSSDTSQQGETTEKSTPFPFELEDGKFEITAGDLWITEITDGSKSATFNLTLKNNTDETIDDAKLNFVLLNEDEKELSKTAFEYENLEPGKETQAKSWVMSLVFDEKEKTYHTVTEDDFSVIKVTGIQIGSDTTEFEKPIIIKKEDLNRKED
jgi:PBP1b-binding outer membrane lipoprotein LpoB